MTLGARLLRTVVARNNARMNRADPVVDNPRDLDACPWHEQLCTHLPAITQEWREFVGAGGQLPHIEEVLGDDQGNIGAWRVGVLTTGRMRTNLATDCFPATVAALSVVPGLRAALWSVLDPGTELTEHCGPNGGVLRYHLGIDCPEGSRLRVGAAEIPYRNGGGILFDDTAPHSARNDSALQRVTLFCEVDRPLPGRAAVLNRLVQRLLAADPRRRRIPALANEWHAGLNPAMQRTR